MRGDVAPSCPSSLCHSGCGVGSFLPNYRLAPNYLVRCGIAINLLRNATVSPKKRILSTATHNMTKKNPGANECAKIEYKKEPNSKRNSIQFRHEYESEGDIGRKKN